MKIIRIIKQKFLSRDESNEAGRDEQSEAKNLVNKQFIYRERSEFELFARDSYSFRCMQLIRISRRLKLILHVEEID